MPDILIFANPIAGNNRGRKVAQTIAAHLSAAGIQPRMFFDNPATIASNDLAGDAIAAITIGGDGTLRAVADRLLAFPNQQVPPLLVVPLGTANLMVRHLGLDWDQANIGSQVVDAIAQNKIRSLDVARANDRLFLLMAGVGLDASVVHELHRLRSGPIDKLSYALPTLLVLRKYQYKKISVEVDGNWIAREMAGLAFVGNIAEYGTGFPILTRARPDDGLLDVCVLPCDSPMALGKLLIAVVTGEHLKIDGAVYVQGKSIRIESASEVAVQIDGDAAGHTPLNIHLLADRLRFIVQKM